MRRDEEGLLNDESIERWIEAHAPDGIEKLLLEVKTGRIAGVRARHCELYLQRAAAKGNARIDNEARELARRGVEASESQADTAKRALERSNIAIVISIVAILFAVLDLATRH